MQYVGFKMKKTEVVAVVIFDGTFYPYICYDPAEPASVLIELNKYQSKLLILQTFKKATTFMSYKIMMKLKLNCMFLNPN